MGRASGGDAMAPLWGSNPWQPLTTRPSLAAEAALLPRAVRCCCCCCCCIPTAFTAAAAAASAAAQRSRPPRCSTRAASRAAPCTRPCWSSMLFFNMSHLLLLSSKLLSVNLLLGTVPSGARTPESPKRTIARTSAPSASSPGAARSRAPVQRLAHSLRQGARRLCQVSCRKGGRGAQQEG